MVSERWYGWSPRPGRVKWVGWDRKDEETSAKEPALERGLRTSSARANPGTLPGNLVP